MIIENVYWFQAMILPVAPNIDMNDFHSHILLLPSYDSILQYINEALLNPVNPEYLFVAFRDGDDHFLYFLFKLVR